MADTLYPPRRPQSVGEILDGAFRIFTATLLGCIALAVVGRIAAQLPNLYALLTGGARKLATAAQDPKWWLFYIAGVCLATWLWGAMLLRQRALITGAPVSLRAELATAARRVPGLIGIFLLMALAFMACFVPVAMFGGLLAATKAAPGPWSIGALVLATMIPILWLALRWSCAATMYLLEPEHGAVGCIARSWQLTTGSFWRLSVIYGVALVLIIVVGVLASIVTGLVAAVMVGGDVAVTIAVVTTSLVLINSIALPFYSAIALMVLADLEVRKEGVDLAQRIAAPATP